MNKNNPVNYGSTYLLNSQSLTIRTKVNTERYTFLLGM